MSTNHSLTLQLNPILKPSHRFGQELTRPLPREGIKVEENDGRGQGPLPLPALDLESSLRSSPHLLEQIVLRKLLRFEVK
jgi:hypothetical protein